MKRYAKEAEIFRLLSHPVRLRILEILQRCGERCVCDLRDELQLRQAHVSQQLALMRGAGLVSCARDGQRRLYRLSDDRLPGLLTLANQIAQEKRGPYESRPTRKPAEQGARPDR